MKVVAFNGSPHREGNTWHALKMVTAELEREGISTEIVTVGDKAIRGVSRAACVRKTKTSSACSPVTRFNEWVQKIKGADGIILGSPVHYAAMSGR